jgi:hypothetical protein
MCDPLSILFFLLSLVPHWLVLQLFLLGGGAGLIGLLFVWSCFSVCHSLALGFTRVRRTLLTRSSWKGDVLLFIGLAVSMAGWAVLGVLVQAFAFLKLFRSAVSLLFALSVLTAACSDRVPIVGPFLTWLPGIGRLL